jgi:type II secretory pathway pseudopilin PulG
MTTNPYQSPENASNLPRQSVNWVRFTVRLAVVVAILGILVAVLLPARRTGVREAVRRIQCSNHLKQIGLALQNYHDDYRSFPPAYFADAEGKPIHSWRVLILPYMEQKSLYDKYSFSEPWNGPNNSKLHSEVLHVYGCPSRPGKQPRTETSYVAIVGAQTAWPGETTINYDAIADKKSDTILIVEMAKSGIHWMEPRDLDFTQMPMAVNPEHGPGMSSPHPNVALAVFADGHTAALTKNTPPEILRRLLMIADGEQIGDY